jgi:outer membrane protein assembly factor BamD
MPYKMNRSIYLRLLILTLCFLFLSSCKYFKKPEEAMPQFDPETAFNEANDLIKTGYFEDARAKLEEIKAKDASQKYATLARIRIADTYFDDEMYEEAAVEYESFLSLHTFHKYAPYAQYRLAMCYFKKIRTVDISYSTTKKALKEFRRLQRNYPRNPYMDVTENRINTCIRILAEYELYVGKFYYKKGSYEAAAGRFRNLLDTYPDSKGESEAMYYLGLSYNNIGEREKAVSTFKSLIEEYPTMELAQKAREQLTLLTGQMPVLIIEK